MESVIEGLQQVGLTEYEAKAYMSLLTDHMSSASALAKKSGVPRTKVYSVLESLQAKGWIVVYSGIPLLFRAVEPEEALVRVRRGYESLLAELSGALSGEAMAMKEKFVVLKHDIGLGGLKDELRSARTVQISNATADLVERLAPAIRPDAVVEVVLYPGERKAGRNDFRFREALVKVVCVMRNKEVPSSTVIVDEGRIFTVAEDPVEERYYVSEMLNDDCCGCLSGVFTMGWDGSKEI
ncbi:MAG TPA: helix-turn-helix domain-containing protein [Methanocella sp.]|nr:helix-turn-helix domain-containing protein [Methanocella sp.]